MIYNIHNENDWRQSVPRTCMCNVDISRTIPTTLFLKTKYLKYHKISIKFRAITNLSCVALNPWLIPRINIQKSNLYRNGFIVKKLIYWSEYTHNRPGWRSKSQYKIMSKFKINHFDCNLSLLHVLNKIEVPPTSVYELSVCNTVRELC